MDTFKFATHQEFEFALLNPQFRCLSFNELTQKIAELKASPDACNYVFSISSAIIDHGGIDNTLDVRQNLEGKKLSEILISHEGSRTGAPVVCRNLVVSLSHEGNPLLISFGKDECFADLDSICKLNFNSHNSRTAYWGFLLGRWLLEIGCIIDSTKVIGSTLETADFITGLCDAIGKGSCILLHEHPYYYGYEKLDRLFAASQAIIYSSDYVLNGWITACRSDADKSFHAWKWKKQPQPIQSDVYSDNNSPLPTIDREVPASQNKISISGAGHIQPRKGVHLFLEIIAEVARIIQKHPKLSHHRIIATWIGQPKHTTEYSLYISSKANWIQRELSNLEVNILPSCDDYLDYIKSSDIFLSTSTVDPLPNVVLDALGNRVPAFIVGGSNGHEEYYRCNKLSELIMPPNNIEASARACLSFLASGKEHQSQIRNRMSVLIDSFPSQSEYARTVREEAAKANLVYQDISHSSIRLFKEGWTCVLQEYGSHFVSYQFPERQAQYGAIIAGLHNHWGYCSKVQSPLSAKYRYISLINSLASKDSLLSLKQSCNEVVSIVDTSKTVQSTNTSYDIHIHSFYPDVTSQILRRIETLSRHPASIFITYPKEVETQVYSLDVDKFNIKFVETPNIGRNILPIKYIVEYVQSDYLIHLHTKKSTHSNSSIINSWNEYLLSSLTGSKYFPSHILKILDSLKILSTAVAYPLEPTYQQIGRNSAGMNELIRRLAGNLDISPLSNAVNEEMYFPYPCGCMFIAEKDFCQKSLGPMISLISPDEVAEPLPYDGTILHALERCIPLLATLSGRDIALILPPAGVVR